MPEIKKLITAARKAYPRRSKPSGQLSVKGQVAVAEVIDAFRADADSTESFLWWNILAEMPRTQVVTSFAEALTDEESAMVAIALTALLGSSQEERAVAPLREQLDRHGSMAAIDALGELRVEGAAAALRSRVAILLNEDAKGTGLERLIAEAREEDYAADLREAIKLAEALAKHGDHSLGSVVCELSRFDRDVAEPVYEHQVVRMEATRALRLVIASESIECLGEAMSDSDPEVVENAIEACLFLGEPASAVHLVSALDTVDPINRQRAKAALRGMLGEDLDGEDARFVEQCLERAASLDAYTCVRFGEPLKIPRIFPALSHVDSHVGARTELLLITGLDVAKAPGPVEWALDLDPEAQARSWWTSHGDRFETGKLYRYGQQIEPPWRGQ